MKTRKTQTSHKAIMEREAVNEFNLHTTRNEGLMVTAVKGSQIYPISLKLTDEDLAASLKLFREPPHSKRSPHHQASNEMNKGFTEILSDHAYNC